MPDLGTPSSTSSRSSLVATTPRSLKNEWPDCSSMGSVIGSMEMDCSFNYADSLGCQSFHEHLFEYDPDATIEALSHMSNYCPSTVNYAHLWTSSEWENAWPHSNCFPTPHRHVHDYLRSLNEEVDPLRPTYAYPRESSFNPFGTPSTSPIDVSHSTCIPTPASSSNYHSSLSVSLPISASSGSSDPTIAYCDAPLEYPVPIRPIPLVDFDRLCDSLAPISASEYHASSPCVNPEQDPVQTSTVRANMGELHSHSCLNTDSLPSGSLLCQPVAAFMANQQLGSFFANCSCIPGGW